MKFNCYYRGDDGSRRLMEIDAVGRHDAFVKAKMKGLRVIEMLPIAESRKQNPKKVVTPEPENVVENEEQKIFKQRAHSYSLGFLLGPIGFIIACLVWKQRGTKYGLYGFLMSIATVVLGYCFGLIGLIAGVILAIVVDAVCIPKPGQQKLNWSNL